MTVNLSQLPDIIASWARKIIGWALLLFIALTVLRLFGLNLYPVPTLGWQELGIFLAGTAYAIRQL